MFLRSQLPPLLLAAFLFPAAAQEAAPAGVPPERVVDLETMVVSGELPGPGMWKVSDGERVLWIMGTLTPLPKRMTWISRDVEEVIAQAQEVIGPPGVSVSSDVGVVRGVMLVPSLLRARKNPAGASLEEAVPAPMYARWSTLKARYMGRNNKVESWRPIFAARELYEEAIGKSGLTEKGVVAPVVAREAKRHKVPVTPALVKLKIEEPKETIKEFSASSLDDVECFGTTLARLETDLTVMAQRANAWAEGDVQALRALPYEDHNRACINTFLQTELARKRGADDLPLRVRTAWLEAAEKSLKTNSVTFATLPVSEMLKPDGYLAQLRARGYVVEEP